MVEVDTASVEIVAAAVAWVVVMVAVVEGAAASRACSAAAAAAAAAAVAGLRPSAARTNSRSGTACRSGVEASDWLDSVEVKEKYDTD